VLSSSANEAKGRHEALRPVIREPVCIGMFRKMLTLKMLARLICTRPDIAQVVNALLSFPHKLNQPHIVYVSSFEVHLCQYIAHACIIDANKLYWK
jgi:hypothetical protein